MQDLLTQGLITSVTGWTYDSGIQDMINSMKHSVGVLPYRDTKEVLLAHPGGPYWEHRNRWSIIKGEIEDTDTSLLDTACREFKEETTFDIDIYKDNVALLGQFKVAKNKKCDVFILNRDFNESLFVSNTCLVEYPLKSGNYVEVLENDKYAWFNIDEALNRVMPGQIKVIEKMKEYLDG